MEMGNTKEIKIFLSCPEEIVKKEIKDVIEKVIREDNIYFKNYGCRFELEHWKEKVYLGKGTPRVQDTINNKLVENCDIFLGILWTRFGSPPGITTEGISYSSGTEEEFYLAKRLDKELWIFFCNIPKNPSEIDPGQLKKMQKFKEELKKEQIWYAEFSEEDELRKILKQNMKNFIDKKYSVEIEEKQNKLPPLPKKEEFSKYNRGF